LERILDLGCGDGAPLAMLRARGIITAGVGLDLLPERVREAATTWPGIEFMVGDAAELPFDDAAFDAVLAMTVLSSIADERRRRRVLSEVARVLRPGGRFVWYDMRRGNPRNPDVRPFTHVDVRAALPAWPAAFRTVTLLPPLARRLGPFTRALYPVGAAVPILRTHEVGRASKPEGIGSNATSSPGQLRPGRA
jgi:SAM-dependent methyltransferase